MKRRSARGFVVLIVLLMLAVISAVAIGQLSVVTATSQVSVRREEDAEARALAEGCLLEMQRNAERFMGATITGVPPVTTLPTTPVRDFDLLLNPTSSATAAVTTPPQHIPALTPSPVAVAIPKGAPLTDHQWGLIRRAGGACLVRYDDNSDDSMPKASAIHGDGVSPGCPAGANEGNNVDVPFCDRDGAIFMTAIGVYPAFNGTPDADVYDRAHARVTLRQLFQVPSPGTFPPGLASAGNIKVENNIQVCGVGGIQADSITAKFKGSSCICGSVETQQTIKTNPPVSSTCCATCSPGGVQTGVTAPRPVDINNDGVPCTDAASTCAKDPVEAGVPKSPLQPIQQPAASDTYLANQGFGNPVLSNNNIGDPAVCKLYFEHTSYSDSGGANEGTVYVWDMSDTSPITNLAGAVLTGVPGDNCQNYTQATVGAPCKWDKAANSVTCTGTQTPCWKPIARLHPTLAAPDADFHVGTTYLPASEFSDATGDYLQIYGDRAIPNVADNAKRFGGSGAALLCGEPTTGVHQACSTCAAGGTRNIRNRDASQTFVFDGAVNNNTLPVPLIMVTADGVDQDNSIGGGVPTPGPILMSILSKKNIVLDKGGGLCCPTCGCTEMYAASKVTLTTTPPNPPPAGNGPGECYIYDPNRSPPNNTLLPNFARFSMTDATNATPALPGNRIVPGFVLKSDTTIIPASNFTAVGITYTKGTYIAGTADPCYVGRLVVGGNFGVNPPGSIMVGGELLVVGNVGGNAINGFTMTADAVYTEGDVDFKNDWTLNGRLYANGDIDVKNNAHITFTGGGSTGAFAADTVSVYMEAQW